MSDNYIYVIPEELGFIPDEAKRQSATDYFCKIAPEADKIAASVSDGLEFVHCGDNFGDISCPSCRSLIGLHTWQDWMNLDFQGKENGFVLSKKVLPCC